MRASTSTKENFDEHYIRPLNKFGIQSILKSAAIFGANASGKSNFTGALLDFKRLVLNSLDSVSHQLSNNIVPFVLKEHYFDEPTEFEVSFILKRKLYRYGISLIDGEIAEEWLYRNEERDTLLFHRDKQTVEFNQSSFSEAKLFVKKMNGIFHIEKTKPSIPFVSVLAQFDGEISVEVTEWFKKLHVISGLTDAGVSRFTINQFESNPNFRKWAQGILKSFHINDIMVTEIEHEKPKLPNPISSIDHKIVKAIGTLAGSLSDRKVKEKAIEVIKEDAETKELYALPLDFESEGTKKLIYLLGPLYDVIQKNEILVVDEFDNKFHSLLCKFIIELYHHANTGTGQLLLTCHDTNLLSKDLFRRDQIWFIEKNSAHESELYSLVEYKEHYTRKDGSYSKNYLLGKYGAIPLFGSVNEIGAILNE